MKTTGGWHAKDYLMKGYFQGKRDAEKELFDVFPDTGVALRPGLIYGSRKVGSGTLPLGILGSPLAMASWVIRSGVCDGESWWNSACALLKSHGSASWLQQG